jgi:hypothetical protein
LAATGSQNSRGDHDREPQTQQTRVNPDTDPTAPRISAAVAASIVVPAIIVDAGDRAARRFLEFIAATIRNRNTRLAYLHAVRKSHRDLAYQAPPVGSVIHMGAGPERPVEKAQVTSRSAAVATWSITRTCGMDNLRR